MSACLVLIGGAGPDAPMVWLRVARGTGAVLDRGQIGGGDKPRAAPADTLLVLPGSEAQLRTLDEVAHTEAQAKAAAAVMFRGALASDTSKVAFVPGQPDAGRKRLVAAFDRPRVALWLERCAREGFAPAAIHLDCTLWPTPADSVDIISLDGRTIIAGGALGGFTIESDLAPPLVTAWLDRLPRRPANIRIVGNDAPAELARLGASHPGELDVPAMLARAALRPPAHAPVLYSRDATTAMSGVRSVRAWGFAAALGILFILVQSGIAVVEGQQDAETSTRLLASAEQQFREARPDVNRIVNLRAQVSSALNATRPATPNPIVRAAGDVTRLLQAHPDVRLDEMRYEASEQRVLLRLSALLPVDLDASASELRVQARSLEVGAMETINGRVSLALSMEAS